MWKTLLTHLYTNSLLPVGKQCFGSKHKNHLSGEHEEDLRELRGGGSEEVFHAGKDGGQEQGTARLIVQAEQTEEGLENSIWVLRIIVGQEEGGKDAQDKRLDNEDYEAPFILKRLDLLVFYFRYLDCIIESRGYIHVYTCVCRERESGGGGKRGRENKCVPDLDTYITLFKGELWRD